MVLQNGVLPVVSHWAMEKLPKCGGPHKLHYLFYREIFSFKPKFEQVVKVKLFIQFYISKHFAFATCKNM